MLVQDCPRADVVRAVVDRIRNGTKAREIAAEAERQRRLEEMLKNLEQFFGRNVQPPTPLYLEGGAVRELLALTKQEALIYHDLNNSTDYYLNHESEVVSAFVNMRNREGGERVLSLGELANKLIEKNIAFDVVLGNVRAMIDRIMACVNEEGVFVPASNDLSAQTHPAIVGGIVTIKGVEYFFPCKGKGFGVVPDEKGEKVVMVEFDTLAGTGLLHGESIAPTQHCVPIKVLCDNTLFYESRFYKMPLYWGRRL